MYSHLTTAAVVCSSALVLSTGTHAQEVTESVAIEKGDRVVLGADTDWREMGTVFFSDDFESGLAAWTVTDVSGSGAQWETAECWASSGNASAACAAGGSAAVACGEDYPGGMKTWLVHGPMDFSDPALQWVELDVTFRLRSEPFFDRFFAGVSADGVTFDGTFFSGNHDSTLDLSDLVGESDVWVGFLFASDASGQLPDGAAIDDVTIRSFSSYPGERAWTISDRSSDPLSNTGVPNPGNRSIWLWYYCEGTEPTGFRTAEFDVEVLAGEVQFFNPSFGFTNHGTDTHLVLEADTCRNGPVRVASWFFHDAGDGIAICIRPTAEGLNYTEACDPHTIRWPNDYLGYDSRGQAGNVCGNGYLCGDEVTVGVDRTSWGSLKASYR